MTERWKCSTCGGEHEGTPFSFAADFPDPYANIARDERDHRAEISSDQCVIDGKQFFIRGCLEIPIIGESEPFLFGVWSGVWENDFDLLQESWHEEGREKRLGPLKGRLANSLATYPETLNLKLTIRVQPVGVRPLFIVDEPEHQLAHQQTHGITRGEAVAMAGMLLTANGLCSVRPRVVGGGAKRGCAVVPNKRAVRLHRTIKYQHGS